MCPDKDKNKHSDLNRNTPASPKEISLTLALDLAYLNALIADLPNITATADVKLALGVASKALKHAADIINRTIPNDRNAFDIAKGYTTRYDNFRFFRPYNAAIAATFDTTYHVAGFAEYVVAEVVGDINCSERYSSADANCPSLVLHYTDIVAHADARVAGAFAGIAAELAKKVRDLEAFFNNWKNFKKA